MTPRPLTIAEKAARLHANHPTWTHSEVMASLAQRRRRKPVFGVLHISNADRRAFDAVESAPKTYAWQQRADLL